MHTHAHSHGHAGHDHHQNGSSVHILFALLLNLAFTIIEFIGGFITNSIAVMSDALHDLGDSIALGSSYFLEKLSHKKRDDVFSYGYRRFSLLSAIINGVVLMTGSVFIIIETVKRLWNPEPVSETGMVILAVVGIFFNALGAIRLSGGSGLNSRMLSWHFWEDVLGWVGVLIAGVVMMFVDFPVLDSILSLLFTIFILYNVTRIFRESAMIFMQSVPGDLDVNEIRQSISSMDHVDSIHDTHLWTMDGEFHVLTTHVVVDDDLSGEEVVNIKQNIRKYLRSSGVEHCTIEMEYFKEECHMENCHENS